MKKFQIFYFFIFFPVIYFYTKQSGIRYYPESDIYEIKNVKMSGQIFLSLESMGENESLTITKVRYQPKEYQFIIK